ncbi:MAG: 5-(carboxyamino)imidazole ribonucleotide synthase [Candidatus Saccharimonadales bacterium]
MEPETIGIIGGGQLGRMLTLAALPLGYRVVVLDPGANCPAAQVGAEQIVGELNNKAALEKLARKSDYVTIEIEHLDAIVLQRIADSGVPVNPSPQTIRLIQDKYAQKQFLTEHGIPLAPYMLLENEAEASIQYDRWEHSMIIKARRGAYDGRGNMVITSYDDIPEAFWKFKDQGLYAERLVPFVKELAVMVAKDWKGNIVTYPVVETIQQRNICLEVLVPAPVSAAVTMAAETIARQVAEHLDGAGLYGIELFLTADDQVLVNEIAPRVHNSGHYTMDACRTSQFEQHIRAIAGLPLGSTELLSPAAVMINILGERDGPTQVKSTSAALAIDGASLHLYGKSPTKIDRKMGHITVTGRTLQEAQDNARKARKAFSI